METLNVPTKMETMYKKIKVAATVQLDYTSKYFYEDESNITDNLQGNYGHPPHPDLKERMDALKSHLAILCEYTDKAPEQLDDIDLQKFEVTSILLTGSSSYETVRISGYRYLKNGKTLTLLTPKCYYENIENYPHVVDLFTCVNLIIDEIEQYEDGKHGQRPQLEMDFKE